MARGRQAAQHEQCGLDPQRGHTSTRVVPVASIVEPADIVVGQQIVRGLTPFLLHMLDQGLVKATVRRHRDKLWLLGGELIRCRYDDNELARQDVRDAIRQLIKRDSGPLMWPRITESEQDSLDATCRKLNRFMSESAAADSSA